MRSGQSGMAVLREQMSAVGERLGREMDLRQSAELQRREAELAARGHLVTSQQMGERLAEVTAQLTAEREAKALQVFSSTFVVISCCVHLGGVLCCISEWRHFLKAGVFSATYPSGGVF